MSARSIRRAAERQAKKAEQKQALLSAMGARPDDPAFLSEAKTQEKDPAERKAVRIFNCERAHPEMHAAIPNR